MTRKEGGGRFAFAPPAAVDRIRRFLNSGCYRFFPIALGRAIHSNARHIAFAFQAISH
ncbi:hypothetical protein [Azospirillum argentinense]|uniref:hypothetical protein n=1 Tax=Azospirillum argentinense TaxID=2970906 RepID=UPI00136427FE|nr:hypothetical protein [Azospirillum argentinense]